MKRGFVLFLLSSLVIFVFFSLNSVFAVEGKCLGGPGPEGNFLTREEGGCCVNDECCNYPATQAWCNKAENLVPFEGIESPIENDVDLKDKGKVIGKIESLKGKAEVKQEDGTWKELKVGDEIKFLDHVQVEKGGKVELKLIDDTLFVSENSYLIINEFVYDPNLSSLERTVNKYIEKISEWITKINQKLEQRFRARGSEGAIAGVRS